MGFARTGSNPVAVGFAIQKRKSYNALLTMSLQHQKLRASLAQWLERSAVNRKVAGSIPAGGAFLTSFQLFCWLRALRLNASLENSIEKALWPNG